MRKFDLVSAKPSSSQRISHYSCEIAVKPLLVFIYCEPLSIFLESKSVPSLVNFWVFKIVSDPQSHANGNFPPRTNSERKDDVKILFCKLTHLLGLEIRIMLIRVCMGSRIPWSMLVQDLYTCH